MSFGKRSLNKAETRLNILRAVYRLSETENFRDLKVKLIVEDAGITEMTFFNYFKKKEDILQYMMGIWALDITAHQIRKPLTGSKAIRRLFSLTAQYVKQHPGLMVSFISFLVTNEIDPNANDIEAADRSLLYPEIPEIYEAKILSGNEMLLKHLQETNITNDHTQTLLHLASCFYGDVIVAHTAKFDLQQLYSKSLDLILGGT